MRFINGILLLALVAAPGFAATFLFQGTFGADNQVELFNIVVSAPQTVQIETYSYAGGTVNSTAFAPGGFAPTAFLFDNLGDVQTINNGTCSQVNKDPTTQNCDDLFFDDPLQAGTYTLALAVYGNSPVSGAVSAGFTEAGDPGFTCQEAGGSGNFCDLTTAFPTSNVRTDNYAIAITGATSVSASQQILTTPEPASVLLLFGACTLLALLKVGRTPRSARGPLATLLAPPNQLQAIPKTPATFDATARV
jgi:hypothetical protein